MHHFECDPEPNMRVTGSSSGLRQDGLNVNCNSFSKAKRMRDAKGIVQTAYEELGKSALEFALAAVCDSYIQKALLDMVDSFENN